MAEALKDSATHPVLGLFVHIKNVKAIRFYKSAGFSDELENTPDKVSGEVLYYKMAMVLNDEALLAFRRVGKK